MLRESWAIFPMHSDGLGVFWKWNCIFDWRGAFGNRNHDIFLVLDYWVIRSRGRAIVGQMTLLSQRELRFHNLFFFGQRGGVIWHNRGLFWIRQEVLLRTGIWRRMRKHFWTYLHMEGGQARSLMPHLRSFFFTFTEVGVCRRACEFAAVGGGHGIRRRCISGTSCHAKQSLSLICQLLRSTSMSSSSKPCLLILSLKSRTT